MLLFFYSERKKKPINKIGGITKQNSKRCFGSSRTWLEVNHIIS